MSVGQIEKAFDRQGQGRVDLQLLRHITDPQGGGACDRAGRGFQCADKRAQQAGFAGPVGTDDGDDLCAFDGEIHVAQNGLPAIAQGQASAGNEAHAASLQLGHRPVASITVRSMAKPASRAAACSLLVAVSVSATWRQLVQIRKAGA